MRAGHHLHLYCLGTTCWTLFFLGGLGSNYYQDWPWPLVVVVLLVLPSAAFVALVRQLGHGLLSALPPRRAAGWVALYLTLPLLAYDCVYLGWHEQRGASFLVSHWYLTAFYAIPWILALAFGGRRARG